MKVIYEFNLPEDQEEYNLHHQASKLHSAIWEYANWLRAICKHGDPDAYNADKCREQLYKFMNEFNVEL